jgi:hypothetical protein
MAEITPPRIEIIADLGTGSKDPPAQKQRAKVVAVGNLPAAPLPEIAAPGEEEKHELDEMA